MKKFISVYLLSFLMIVGLTCSCSKQNPGKVIPKDAIYVMSFNVEKAIDAVDADDDDVESLKSEIEKTLKKARISSDMRTALTEMVSDPAKMGVDFRYPLMIFSNTELRGVAAMAGVVYDKDNLEESLKVFHKLGTGVSSVDDSGDLSYVKFGHDVVFAFNDEIFLMYPTVRGNVSETVSRVEELYEQKADASLMQNEAFEKMCNKDGVFQSVFLGEGLEELLLSSGSDMREMRQLMPEDIELSDYAIVTNLNIKKGEALFEYEAVPMSDAAKKYLEELPTGEIVNDFGDYLDREDLFYAVANVKGGLFWEMMSSNELFKNEFRRHPEEKKYLETIFNAVDGDIAFAFEDFNYSEEDFKMSFFAKGNNSEWLDAFNKLSRHECTEKNNHTLVYSETNYYGEPRVWMQLEEKDNDAYLVVGKTERDLEEASDKVEETGKGKNFYARLNLKQLVEMPFVADALYRESRGLGNKIMELFDYVEMYSEDHAKVTMRVVMKDDEETPIKAIFDEVYDFYKRFN